MRLSIGNTKHFKAALKAALTVASKNEASNIIQLYANDGKLFVIGTDYSDTIWLPVEAEIPVPGRVSLSQPDAKKLLSLMPPSVLNPKHTLELELQGERLQGVVSETSFFFPASGCWLPEMGDKFKNVFQVESKELYRIISEVSHAKAGIHYYRKWLACIHLESKDKQLQAVSTDMHRLALAVASATKAKDKAFQAQIGHRAIKAILPLLRADKGKVKLSTSGEVHRIQTNSFELYFSNKGNYPNFEKVIPKSEDITVVAVVSRADILAIAKEALALHQFDKGDICNRVILNPHAKGIKISVRPGNAMGGKDWEIESLNSIKDMDSPPLQIAINAKFLVDALSAWDYEEVQFNFTKQLSPALIRPLGSDSHSVVMPVAMPS